MKTEEIGLLRKMLLENVGDESITREWADWFYDEFQKKLLEEDLKDE